MNNAERVKAPGSVTNLQFIGYYGKRERKCHDRPDGKSDHQNVAPVRGAEPERECNRLQSYVRFGATRNATPVGFFGIPGRA